MFLPKSPLPKLSLSRKSLIGRLMLAFGLLALLLLLLVSLGSVSLRWVQEADKYLYNSALPASEAASQLALSSNALAENAGQLGQTQGEAQRQFVGRKLSIESASMLSAIKVLKALEVNFDLSLEQSASDIIADISELGKLVGQRIQVANSLQKQGKDLVDAASISTELLLAELAIVDSGILSKLSLAYPDVVGAEKTSELLDTLIEQDLDTQERLNRALKIVHNIALMGQMFQSPELESGIYPLVGDIGSRIAPAVGLIEASSVAVPRLQAELGQAHRESLEISHLDKSISDSQGRYLSNLTSLTHIIRDPERANTLARQFAVLQTLPSSLSLQKEYTKYHQAQELQLQTITDKLDVLNEVVANAMQLQRIKADNARSDYLKQLTWSKFGLWMTGLLMFLVIFVVVYKVIYKGIALKLDAATKALAQLSLGNTAVTIDTQGDDELAAMASAIKAFKQKTDHNQKLQAELRETAAELYEHKQALEAKVEARTLELAEANIQLDKEAKGHVIARDMAEQANQAKSLFLATMSHEIRTPLNGLLGTLTLLGHSNLPPAQQQMLALSQYSGTLLQTVLNDILDFSRLEQRKLANEPRAVDINELLDQVVAIMLAGAGLAGLTLRSNHVDLPKWIYIDGPKLRQVLLNLLGNAIKFTPQGEVELVVEVKQGLLQFKVQDTGVGIDPEAMKKLFKAYSNEPSKGRDRGTGLGLAISKQLVELMNSGTQTEHNGVWVTSEVGKGSCFGFSLPLVVCDRPDYELQQQVIHTQAKNLLVIEDNKINAMVAQGFLAHLGHSSVLAKSCEAARKAYTVQTAKQFDAIMLDIQLGDGSGIELLAELQEVNRQAGHQIEIAAFTAQLQADDMENYQEKGFNLVLMKPLDMQALSSWLGNAEPLQDFDNEVETALGAELDLSVKTTSPVKDSDSLVNVRADTALLDEVQLTQDLTYLGLETVNELARIYQQTSEVHFEGLLKVDADIGHILHALKGSSANMGLASLSERCKLLEKSAMSPSQYQQTEHDSLKELWQASQAALQAWIAEQPKT
ncbi:TMAO reductase system sensor histidine kinase/response regulator TorS [Shewanella pealeana]|uniref:histidine kinase n=1 Tax=Shewanella pealeana (strain ATCC 700345 / ANG-SQ1) TaxID=398579 RepID=A8H7X3_SHEPA|nr:TMAO reductase system sensor histidine kinase/response regulator TorS [Shewanella pealeana]ABV88660.1 Hpt sensor hybrid histidine kinase [Shewanella pealeana ATCC 700345]